ncbi:MAG: hypothetical protein HY914_03550, partial [Desulfomonile tiedjei]|nr:hypothetical protein [Desulfomonile tiedjei]
LASPHPFMSRDHFIQYGFRISTDLLDAVRKRTANVSEYLRTLIENDLGQDAGLREYPRTPYVYHAKLTEVIDGDTLKLELDVGFEITLHATIRLEQINAPEIDTAAGKRAKAFLQKKQKGAYLVIETKKRGKYGAPGQAGYFLPGESPGRARVSRPPVSSVARKRVTVTRSVHREACRPQGGP